MKPIVIIFLTTSILTLSACLKDSSLIVNESRSITSDVHTDLNSKSLETIYQLWDDFNQQSDAIISLQSYQTYFNQAFEEANSSITVSSASPYLEDNAFLSLELQSETFESNSNGLIRENYSSRESAPFQFGSEASFSITNDEGNLGNFSAYLPLPPEIYIDTRYTFEEFVGITVPLGDNYELIWDADPNNPLNGVVVRLQYQGIQTPELMGTNVNYYITEDDGSFMLTSDILGEYMENESIDVSIMRGSYNQFDFGVNNDLSLTFYSIMHNHLPLVVK